MGWNCTCLPTCKGQEPLVPSYFAMRVGSDIGQSFLTLTSQIPSLLPLHIPSLLPQHVPRLNLLLLLFPPTTFPLINNTIHIHININTTIIIQTSYIQTSPILTAFVRCLSSIANNNSISQIDGSEDFRTLPSFHRRANPTSHVTSPEGFWTLLLLHRLADLHIAHQEPGEGSDTAFFYL